MTEFSGSLRERVRIERPSAARDALGSAGPARELVGEFWATAEPAGSDNAERAESRSSMQHWRFSLRNTDAILPGDYLHWSAREMVIVSVTNEHRPTPKTILLAEERR